MAILTVDGLLIENGILKRCPKDTPGVTIPVSVTEIGRNAFDGCGLMKSVTIPDSVTSIGDEAFRWCSKLTSVVIPDSVTTVGMLAFQDCSGLTSVTIGSGVKELGYAVFSNCYRLKTVTVAGMTITKPSAANSEQIGDICNMILQKDYAEENLFPYIKKNFTKFMTFLTETGNAAAITKAIENGKLLTKRNIDKFIELAINGGQHEIYLLLVNCKSEMTGLTDPTEKFKL